MSDKRFSRRDFLRKASALALAGSLAAACQPKEVVVEKVVTQVVEREVTKIVAGTPQVVKETVIVEKEVAKVVEKEVTKIVEKVVKAPGEKVKLVYFRNARPAQAQIVEASIQDFNEANPDIEIEFQYMGWAQYMDKLQVIIAGGADLDVVLVSSLFYRNFAQKGVLLPLDSFLFSAEIPYLSGLPDDHWDDFEVGGKVYAYSTNVGLGACLYVNEQMFLDAGLDLPPTDWDDPGWTYDDYLEAAKALTIKKGDRIVQYGCMAPGNFWGAFNQYLYSFGGRWWSEDYSKWMLTTPEAIEAMQFMADLRLKHGVSPFPDAAQIANWQNGNVAMSISWVTEATNMGYWDYDWEWDHYVPPRGPLRSAGESAAPGGHTIFRDSKHPKEAFTFITFLEHPDRLRGDVRICRSMNAFKGMKEEWGADQATLKNKEVGANAGDYTSKIEKFRMPAAFPDIQTIVKPGQFDYIWNGEKGVEEAFREVEDEINKLLKNNPTM